MVGRDLWMGQTVRYPHGVLPAFGLGMIAGSYVAAWLFRSRLEPDNGGSSA